MNNNTEIISALTATPLDVKVVELDAAITNPAFGLAAALLTVSNNVRAALVSSDTEALIVELEEGGVLANPPRAVSSATFEEMCSELKGCVAAVVEGTLSNEQIDQLPCKPWGVVLGRLGTRWQMDHDDALELTLEAAQLHPSEPDALLVSQDCVYAQDIGCIRGDAHKIAARMALEFKGMDEAEMVLATIS